VTFLQKFTLQAKDAVERSLKSDGNCSHAYFILFKLAIIENNIKQGNSSS